MSLPDLQPVVARSLSDEAISNMQAIWRGLLRGFSNVKGISDTYGQEYYGGQL